MQESQYSKAQEDKIDLMDTIESLKEQKMDLKKKFENIQKRNGILYITN